MKRVMTATLLAAAVVVGGVGTASAAQPSRSDRQTQQGCRTYSSVKECGKLDLNAKQRACEAKYVKLGMTQSRAEVECHAFD
ncbi:hypothetical protein [Actinomadura opuntiae]|uniref:hypothetical protein n=1 Tax=Actinomadura sp. OS1-43 TaxID=604315 RepID=UPI00255ABA35|nr:hypothetical protein [Actinomadura sp. OS1-43]MDL4820912.1 hypothetical protein [Actinomadura sp. OS1-43]